MNGIPWIYVILSGSAGTSSLLKWYRRIKDDLHPCVDSNIFLVQAQCGVVVADCIAMFLVLFLVGLYLVPVMVLIHVGLCIYAVIIMLRGIEACREGEISWRTPAFSLFMAVVPPLLGFVLVLWWQDDYVRYSIQDERVGSHLELKAFDHLEVPPELISAPTNREATPSKAVLTVCVWVSFTENGTLAEGSKERLDALAVVQRKYISRLRAVCICVPPVERLKGGALQALPVDTKKIVQEMVLRKPAQLLVEDWRFDRELHSLNPPISALGAMIGTDSDGKIVFRGNSRTLNDPDKLDRVIRKAFPKVKRR
jgi:hypothetical protein